MYVHHVGLSSDAESFNRMREFYLATLRPAGYKVYKESEGIYCGFQAPAGSLDFWLHGSDAKAGDRGRSRTHVAFGVSSRQQVDAWYQNALKAGGTPNGPPGERHYIKGYYAAFVLDPMGNNIEAVCFNPLWLQALKAAPYVIAGIAGATIGYSFHLLSGIKSS